MLEVSPKKMGDVDGKEQEMRRLLGLHMASTTLPAPQNGNKGYA